MTYVKSNKWSLTYGTLGLLALLLVPQWVAMILLINMVAVVIIQALYQHRELFIQVKRFVLEFLGFCFLVGSFLATMVLFYGLLFA